MPITQARMIALISAAHEYQSARDRIIHEARNIILDVVRGTMDGTSAAMALDFAIESTRVSEAAAVAIAVERKHFQLTKNDNERRRVKQSIRRFERRTGETILPRLEKSEKQFDAGQAIPLEPRPHKSKPRMTLTTAPAETPEITREKLIRGVKDSRFLRAPEAYQGLDAGDLAAIQETSQRMDAEEMRETFRRIAQGGEEAAAPAEPIGIATPEPDAFREDEAAGPESEPDF